MCSMNTECLNGERRNKHLIGIAFIQAINIDSFIANVGMWIKSFCNSFVFNAPSLSLPLAICDLEPCHCNGKHVQLISYHAIWWLAHTSYTSLSHFVSMKFYLLIFYFRIRLLFIISKLSCFFFYFSVYFPFSWQLGGYCYPVAVLLTLASWW